MAVKCRLMPIQVTHYVKNIIELKKIYKTKCYSNSKISYELFYLKSLILKFHCSIIYSIV